MGFTTDQWNHDHKTMIYYKHMTEVSKNVYINKFNNIVEKYNNLYQRTIKMKPVDVKWSIYIDFDIESNAKYPRFKLGDHVRISKYKNNFANQNVFVIKEV